MEERNPKHLNKQKQPHKKKQPNLGNNLGSLEVEKHIREEKKKSVRRETGYERKGQRPHTYLGVHL